MSIILLTDDAYGTLILEWQGADLQTQVTTITAVTGETIGAWAQDPTGWAQRYFRPNPYSTAGLYVIPGFSGGWIGGVWPYVPTVVVKLYLAPESTQPSAYINAGATTIAITDEKAFIRSLRRVLDAKSSLYIDPALQTVGPAEFELLKDMLKKLEEKKR